MTDNLRNTDLTGSENSGGGQCPHNPTEGSTKRCSINSEDDCSKDEYLWERVDGEPCGVGRLTAYDEDENIAAAAYAEETDLAAAFASEPGAGYGISAGGDPETEMLVTNIIDACYTVHLHLPPGHVEWLYQNALMLELQWRGIKAAPQVKMKALYKEVEVGEFKADIVVEGKVVLELKAVSGLMPSHEVQLVNYLTTSGIQTGLLVNFGSPRIQIKRKFLEYRRRSAT